MGTRVIEADRFIVQSRRFDDWLAARRRGVTATAVAHAATPSGFQAEVDGWHKPGFGGNEFTDFGNWAEPIILDHAHREFGILPSDWLIAARHNRAELGTPDGVSPDHRLIAEAKTGGTIPRSVPRQHFDQCQWNLAVTDAERCLYLFQHRVRTDHGTFRLGLWEPITFWVDRDDQRIAELREIAAALMEARHARLPY